MTICCRLMSMRISVLQPAENVRAAEGGRRHRGFFSRRVVSSHAIQPAPTKLPFQAREKFAHVRIITSGLSYGYIGTVCGDRHIKT